MKKIFLLIFILSFFYPSVFAQTWQQAPMTTAAQNFADSSLQWGEANQWQKAIKFSPANTNTVWMGVDTSSIWKCENFNDTVPTWEPKNKGIYATGVTSIAPSGVDEDVCCIATGNYNPGMAPSNYTTGIYRTTDGGDTWEYKLYINTKYDSAYHISEEIISFAGTSTTVYCGSMGQGIWKSEDSGDTWAPLEEPSGAHTFSGLKVFDVKPDPSNKDIIYVSVIAGTSSTGIHKLTTSGTTVTSRQYLSASKKGSDPAWKSFKTANGIYICIPSGSNRGIYRSTNEGTTFNAINNGITSLTSYELNNFQVSSDDRGAFTQKMRGGNASYWYCDDLSVSTPLWKNPVSADSSNAEGWIIGSIVTGAKAEFNGSRPTAFHPENSQIMLSHVIYNVLVKSTDGGQNWEYCNHGYVGVTPGEPPVMSDFTVMCADSSNPAKILRGASDYSIRITQDAGETWKPLYNYIAAVGGNKRCYSGAIRPGIDEAIVSIGSRGSQQLQKITGLWDTTPSFTTVDSTPRTYYNIQYNGSNTSIIYANSVKSTNGGTSWSTMAGGRQVDAVHPTNGNVVYDCVQSGSNILVYRSTDAGETWSQPFAAFPVVAGDSFGQFICDPSSVDRVYLCVRPRGVAIIATSSASLSNSGLIATIDGDYDYRTISVDRQSPNIVYVAGSAQPYAAPGICRSTDYGATWSDYNGNLGPGSYANIWVHPETRKVYANSYHGLWVTDPTVEEPPPPEGGLPAVLTGTATAVTQTTATLQGSVNPNAETTTYRWQYGTESGNLNSVTGSQSAGSGESAVDVTNEITGLDADTTYYTRIQANNTNGSVNGSETTFTTLEARKQYETVKVGLSDITIDGDLSDWPALTNSFDNTTNGTPVAQGTWLAQWNNNGIFYACEISDENLYADSGSSLWIDDGIQLYIDRDNDKAETYNSAYDRNYAWNYHGTTTWVNSGGTTEGIEIGTSSVAGGYKMEIFIPWSVFTGGAVPDDNFVIGFDAQLNDDNNGGGREGARTWNNTEDTNYYNTNNFGELKLLAAEEEEEEEAGSITPGTSSATWKFNEGTGSNVFDELPGTSTGTITGASWIPSPFGQNNHTLQYDGIDDYVEYGSPTALAIAGANQHISIFARVLYLDGANTTYIVSKWDDSNNNRQYRITLENGIPRWGLSGTGKSLTAAQICPILGTGSAHNIGFVYDDVDVRSYLDGVQTGTTTYSNGIYNGTASVGVGAKIIAGVASSYFNGIIDDVRIFNRALNQTEIDAIQAIPVSVTGSSSSVTQTSAVLAGSATANGTASANARFRYGTVSGEYTGTSTEMLVTGTTPVSVSRTISNLSSSTEYFYVLEVYNSMNSSFGTESTFTTLGTDEVTPIGTVTINSDGTYTTSTAVTLNLTAVDAVGVEEYFLSTEIEVPYGTQSGWVSVGTETVYSADIPYTLSSGDGTKTINVWYKDGAGNISTMASDDIILDTTFVSIAIMSPESNCTFSDAIKAYGTSNTTLTVSGSAYDLANVALVQISNSGTTTIQVAIGTESWSKEITLVPGVDNLISVTGTDLAGNQGTDTIHIGEFAVVNTGEAINITKNSGILTGTVTINDGNTATVHFDYGVGIYNVSSGEYEGYGYGDYTGSSTSQNIAPTDVTDGLVFRAKLDEESGNAIDSVAGLVGTTTGATSQAGQINKAFYFDGIDDYVSFGDPADGSLDFGTDTSFSFGGWKKTNAFAGTYDTFLAKRNTGSTAYNGYAIVAGSANWYCTMVQGTGTARFCNFVIDGSIYHNTWVHLFAVVDRSSQNLKAYLNGTQVGTTSISVGAGDVSTTLPLYIGRSSAGIAHYNKGLVDDIRIYDRALPSLEVATIYNEGLSGRQVSVNVALGNLIKNTQYFYRLIGSNSVGITYGNEFSFVTLSEIPEENSIYDLLEVSGFELYKDLLILKD